ncbi:phosphoadenosine phosphosulfate reductase family protein [Pseudovibrio sp. Ad26]|uniref:phosphoadenosine phosphosulfate reductase domain-containing protein n=1 Tax=Pseudovibrio sp. Ad26 TaxID=989410 RepID=UPI0007B1F8C3|nr:phosphoadenosine phosphosulfate reductase family protein [Pseudovibrio sp. Ad26]KZL03587.1 Phosphoadenosine phosphosulfate reductase family protein [Pseudovibrio sp. Ad26]
MILERKKITDLIKRGAIFYVSHSGGKDSQAMYAALTQLVPDHQIVVVHADLGVVEWDGVQDHIKATIHHSLNVVQAAKTFFDMVEHRARTRPDVPPWPSSSTRQCTSDLKRGLIYKFIRASMKARGATLALNCTGIRAQESSGRARKEPLRLNAVLSKAGREVYEYMPIHHLTSAHVFAIIERAGQVPFHAYRVHRNRLGNDRLSCVFCIMGSANDLRHGARCRPDLYQKYLELEERTGWTMFNGKSLKQRVEGTTARKAA